MQQIWACVSLLNLYVLRNGVQCFHFSQAQPKETFIYTSESHPEQLRVVGEKAAGFSENL